MKRLRELWTVLQASPDFVVVSSPDPSAFMAKLYRLAKSDDGGFDEELFALEKAWSDFCFYKDGLDDKDDVVLMNQDFVDQLTPILEELFS